MAGRLKEATEAQIKAGKMQQALVADIRKNLQGADGVEGIFPGIKDGRLLLSDGRIIASLVKGLLGMIMKNGVRLRFKRVFWPPIIDLEIKEATDE
jgi:hypothetical protein